MSLEAFISGKSVVTASGAMAPAPDPARNRSKLEEGGGGSGIGGNGSGTGVGNGSDDDKNGSVVLAERTHQLMSSYRDFIQGSHQRELMDERIAGHGNDFGMRERGGGGGAPLLREWNGAGGGGSDFCIDDNLWDGDDDLESNLDGSYKDECAKKYRYAHPAFRSKKLKKTLLLVAVAGAIAAVVGVAINSSRRSSLPNWNEELDEVLGEKKEEEMDEEREREKDKELGNGLPHQGIGIAGKEEVPGEEMRPMMGVDAARGPTGERQEGGEEEAPPAQEGGREEGDPMAGSVTGESEEGAKQTPKGASKVEAQTRHVLCCSPVDPGTDTAAGAANLAAAEYARAESHHPVWYDRSAGWAGTTYKEAVNFCASLGAGTELCPYEAYCPEGARHIPFGGYQGGDNGVDIAGGGDSSLSSRSPIGDYKDGWVQVGTVDACVQYTVLEGHGDGSGGGDAKDGAMDMIMEAIAEGKENGGGAEDAEEESPADAQGEEDKGGEAGEEVTPIAEGEDQEGLVEESYVAFSVEPDPSAKQEEEAKEDQANEEEEKIKELQAEKEQAKLEKAEEQYEKDQMEKKEQYEKEQEAKKEQYEKEQEAKKEQYEKEQEEKKEQYEKEQQAKEQPAQQPPKPKPGGNLIIGNASASSGINVAGVLHQKFKPLWLSKREGWNGGSHADAVAYCRSVRGKSLCPYSAMCPHGQGGAVMGGRHQLEFQAEGEQYAPFLEGANHWAMIGMGKDGDGKTRCMTHRQIEGRSPAWGLNGDRPELKKYIMCCTMSQGQA